MARRETIYCMVWGKLVPLWRPRRKVIAPTFSQHILNRFVDVFHRQSSIMADQLTSLANGRTFSIWNYMTSYTMDSVYQTTLGNDMNVQKSTNHPFLRHFQEYINIVAKRIFCPWIQNDTSFKYQCYFGMYSQSVGCIRTVHGFVNDIIVKKKQEMKANRTKSLLPKNFEKEKQTFKPILELLIETSGGDKGYTIQELQEETLVVVLAGTDTSAVGSAFLALMLASHPQVQEKAYQELSELYGDSDQPVRAEDLPKLSYLEAVVKETLRLYPPVPVSSRKVQREDVTRYKYAMMSMMTATATLLRRYRFLHPDGDQLDKPLRVTYEVMMKHADGFQLKLVPRK